MKSGDLETVGEKSILWYRKYGKRSRRDTSVILEPFRKKVLLLSGLTKNTITCFTTESVKSVLDYFLKSRGFSVNYCTSVKKNKSEGPCLPFKLSHPIIIDKQMGL